MDDPDSTLVAEDRVAQTKRAKLLTRGEGLGRYVVLDRLGSGGMGVVYTAFDPQLDRKVALKVLHHERETATGTDGSPRLLREAQALAKLSHPNVVAVHDVGILDDGMVFLAMEFVDGQTLGDWSEGRRSWRERVAMFVAAGRGLATAHGQGIVHRDFKPDNVMIGPDGRPRVLDFGLARAAEAEVHPGAAKVRSEPSHDIPLTVSNTLDAKLTITGAVMGTPAYMAPEQHLGKAVDERSDQFAFCVALYEAVYGERPFAGDNAPALAFQVCRGEVREAPKGTEVPGWLRKILLRGLALEPNDRYPNMDALLRELDRDPLRSRRRVVLGVGAALAIVALAIFGQRSLTTPKPCTGAKEHLVGVWDDAARANTQEAFAALEVDYAEDAWAETRARLDDYAAAWIAMHEDACAATRIRGEQSDEMLTLRMACLDRGLTELRSLVAVYQDVDVETLAQAVAAADALPSLRLCADLDGLVHEVRPPDREDQRAAVEAIREPLAEVHARQNAGQRARSCELVEPLRPRAEASEYRPLIAEVEDAYGYCAQDAETRVEALERAVWMAEASRHERVAAEAWVHLAEARAQGTNDFDGALDAIHWADAAIERLGGDADLRAFRDATAGHVLLLAARPLEAVTVLRRAHEARMSAGEASQAQALYELVTLINALMSLKEYEEVDRLFDEYLPIAREQLGPHHPWFARLLSAYARALFARNELDAAEGVLREAAAAFTSAFGPDSHDVGAVYNGLGLVLHEAGRSDEAIAAYERALANFRATVGERHINTARTLHNLGNLERELGRDEAALAHLLEAREILVELYDPEHPDVAFVIDNIGDTLRALGRLDEAAARYDEALASFAAAGDEYEAAQVYTLTGRALTRIEQSRPAEALADFEAAEQIVGKRREDVNDSYAGRLAFAFGKFLWESGRDRERGRELVERGRSDYQEDAGSPTVREELAEIDAWLAAHP